MTRPSPVRYIPPSRSAGWARDRIVGFAPLRSARPTLNRLVGYSSGQRGQTVNLLAYAYEGSNPSPTTTPFLPSQNRSSPRGGDGPSPSVPAPPPPRPTSQIFCGWLLSAHAEKPCVISFSPGWPLKSSSRFAMIKRWSNGLYVFCQSVESDETDGCRTDAFMPPTCHFWTKKCFDPP